MVTCRELKLFAGNFLSVKVNTCSWLRAYWGPVLSAGSSRRQAASSSPDYCIIDLNGHRQLVEEGSVFAASAAVLPIGQVRTRAMSHGPNVSEL